MLGLGFSAETPRDHQKKPKKKKKVPSEEQKQEEDPIKFQGPLVLDKCNNFVYEHFNQQIANEEKLEDKISSYRLNI